MSLLKGIKKVFMIQVWRIQQTQAVLALMLVSVTLTGIFFPYVRPHFIGQGLAGPITGMALLFGTIFLILLSLGLMYDTRLELWRPRMEVTIERDPYSTYKLYPRETAIWRELWHPLARALERYAEDEDSRKASEASGRWATTGYLREDEE